MKKLEIGNFYVRDIVFGGKTNFQEGILTVNKKEALKILDPDQVMHNVQLHIAHPGDKIRIIPAKFCVEPRFRPDGRCVFPGCTGPAEGCGEGIVYAMKGISVISAGKFSGGGLIDMSGPGAAHCAHAQTVNLVVYGEVEGESVEEEQKTNDVLRMAGLRLSEYVGKTVEGQKPEEWETYELETGAKEACQKDLPRVALYLHVVNQGAARGNDLLLGHDTDNILPVLVHPNDIFDGVFMARMTLMGQGISTYDWQNFEPLKALYAQHGKTVNLTGVVIYTSPVADQKKRDSAIFGAELGAMLGLNGAVVCQWCGGCNSDVDFMYQIAELEKRGIKVVGISTEHNGKVTADPVADALVCAGDTGPVIELPPMEHVIGDIQSIMRDKYFGAWSVHEEYGPSLRPDGSLIVQVCLLDSSANGHGRLKKAVLDY